jgi:organic hydroperoxide reductase OsmC/OhrA
VFNGDDRRHNPETLMVSSLMACHHLTYLAVCERAGVKLLAYDDTGIGTLAIKDGKMRMVEVLLRPRVVVADAAQVERALALHDKAHAHCFMSNSVNFEVRVQPEVSAGLGITRPRRRAIAGAHYSAALSDRLPAARAAGALLPP